MIGSTEKTFYELRRIFWELKTHISYRMALLIRTFPLKFINASSL